MTSARRRALLVAAAASAVGACATDAHKNHDGPGAPAAAPLSDRPGVAWVFSSGGPRGFVHVGVLKALAELGLEPDVIVGTSVGAMVGVLRAAGLPAASIERLAMDIHPWRMMRWNPAGPEPWSGKAIAAFIDQATGARQLEGLAVPMVCVAQRLADGVAVGFTRGDAGLAVQASTAIEGEFAPVTIRGERYADADLVRPLPVRLAKRLGSRRVLAVDASAYEDRAPPGTESYRQADLHKRALTEPDARAADLLLHPDTGYWAGYSDNYRRRVIDIGYRETLAQTRRLRELHAR